MDSLWGIMGMLVGGGLYAELYPLMKASVLTWGDFSKITLPQILGLNHWIVIAAVLFLAWRLLVWFEKRGL